MELAIRKPVNTSFSADGVQTVWDATSIALAESCMRKYQYRMIDGWRSRGESVHLKFGGAYATALEHFFKHVALGASRDEALRLVVAEALISTWEYEWEDVGPAAPTTSDTKVADGRLLRRIPGSGRPWESGHSAKTRENLIRTIVWYLAEFEDDPAKVVILSSGAPAVEHSFLLPVDNDIVFSGHIDRLVEYSGGKYVMDQKTTGTTLSPRYFDQYSPHIQMSMYTYAGKAVFDTPVSGVIIDGAQIAVGFSRFLRGMTFRTQDQLEEWYIDTLDHIKHAQDQSAAGRFPQNPTACNDYGGCEFRHVCSRNPASREAFLKADFTYGEPWDPLNRR